MRLDELHPASYKGAFFFIKDSSTIGGRKVARKIPIDSDLQLIEDLGLQQRSFSITGFLSARRDNSGNIITSYQQVRDTFLEAVEEGGAGILSHPFFGRIEDLIATSFTLDEKVATLGFANITITFEKTLGDGFPKITNIVITKISNGSAAINTLAQSAIGRFLVTFADNFAEGISKLQDYESNVRNLIKPLSSATNKYESFIRDLTNFRTNIPTLVNSPANMATRVVALGENILGLTPIDSNNQRAHLDSFKLLFDYGDDDVVSTHNTAQAMEKKANRDALNTPIQAMALAKAYLSAAQIKFETVDDIEAESNLLDIQYKKLAADTTIDPDVLDELTDLRVTTQSYFDDQKLTARQIVTVRVNPTSTRLLAYQYYGASDLGDEIADLNDFKNSVYVQGNLKILSV